MGRKEKISKLLGESIKIQSELARLREGCEHNGGYYVGLWSYRVGQVEVSKICSICQMHMPGVTADEIKHFIEQRKNG